MHIDTVFGFYGYFFFNCLVGCLSMNVWTPVFCVFCACVLYFCICTCSVQMSIFHMERRFRNTLIIIIIIIIIIMIIFIIIIITVVVIMLLLLSLLLLLCLTLMSSLCCCRTACCSTIQCFTTSTMATWPSRSKMCTRQHRWQRFMMPS